MTIPRFCIVLLIAYSSAHAVVQADDGLRGETPGVWPIKRLKSEIPKFRIEDPAAKIQALIYEGEQVDGQATEVFSFYASPKTLGKSDGDETYPGIVLIHGGDGTAFADWVWMWANRGYAAIAMDLGGRRPPAPQFDDAGQLKPYTVPTLWVNGTHDNHYVLDSYAKSYALVQGPRTMRIEPRLDSNANEEKRNHAVVSVYHRHPVGVSQLSANNLTTTWPGKLPPPMPNAT